MIIQSPSLHFPSWLTEDPNRIADLQPVSHLLRNAILAQQQLRLDINLLHFAISYSIPLSKLARTYCSLPKPMQNLTSIRKESNSALQANSKAMLTAKPLKEIVAHEPGIILTGYVDESSKLDLYLNALGLLSPSLVEGFGIPVLDGACLGMPTIASDCESHLEIQNLHDFEDTCSAWTHLIVANGQQHCRLLQAAIDT